MQSDLTAKERDGKRTAVWIAAVLVVLLIALVSYQAWLDRDVETQPVKGALWSDIVGGTSTP